MKKRYYVLVYLLIGLFVTMVFIRHGAGRHMGYAGLVLIPVGPFIWPLYALRMVGHDVNELLNDRQRARERRNAFKKAMAVCPEELEPACDYHYANIYLKEGDEKFTRKQAEQSLLDFVIKGKLPDNEGERERYIAMGGLCSIENTRLLLAGADTTVAQNGAVLPASASLFAARRMLPDLDRRLETIHKANNSNKNLAHREATPEFVRQAADDIVGVTASFERWLAENPTPGLYIHLAFLWEDWAEAIKGREGTEIEYKAARARAYVCYEKAVLESPDAFDVKLGLYAVLLYKKSWAAIKPLFAACLQTFERGRWLDVSGTGDSYIRWKMDDFYSTREVKKFRDYWWDEPRELMVEEFWPFAENEDERRDMARLLLPLIAKISNTFD